MKNYKSLALTIAIGVVCIGASYWLLDFLSSPDLRLHLISVEGRILIRFKNVGGSAVELDVGRMEYFLMPPADASRRCIVQVRDKLRNPADIPNLVVLRRGDTIDIGDVTPYLRGLPSGTISLTAIYSSSPEENRKRSLWRGFVRSLPMTVEIQ